MGEYAGSRPLDHGSCHFSLYLVRHKEQSVEKRIVRDTPKLVGSCIGL
jgi:hypothetical protein